MHSKIKQINMFINEVLGMTKDIEASMETYVGVKNLLNIIQIKLKVRIIKC